MSEIERFEGGDTRQFTVTLSVAPDGAPSLAIYNSSGTLVSSATASQSGAGYNYYSMYSLPASAGFYKYQWVISVGSLSYTSRGQFEIILTDADQEGLYCDPVDLRNMYKKLDTSGLTNAEINEFIADADHEINFALAGKYDVPFATSVVSFPPMIGIISKNLSLCNILERQVSQGTGALPEWLVAKRERMEKYLEGLTAGSYTLVTSGGGVIGAAKDDQPVWSSTENYFPVFSMLSEEDSSVDPDLLTDEEDLRI